MSTHTGGLMQRGEEHESMVEIQQTEEPYTIIGRATGGRIGFRAPSWDEMQANARRMVAVWNACAGIPTEALESGALASVLKRLTEAADINCAARKPHEPGSCVWCDLRALGRLP